MVRAGALAAGVALLCLGAAPAKAGFIHTVNSVGDESDLNTLDAVCDVSASVGSQCTLRAAIEQGNANPAVEPVNFNIPGGGVQEIAVDSPLPTVTAPLQINGYTQPGAAANDVGFPSPLSTQIKLFLNGEALDPFEGPGLEFGAGSEGSSVSGLAIGNFPFPGILGEVPVTIKGNFLGTNAAGTRARPNTEGFFGAGGNGTQIGGPDFGDPNLISGNRIGGIVTNSAVIAEGNYIGTTRDGKTALPNATLGGDAVTLASISGSNEIRRNVIAHSSDDGISLVNTGPGSLFAGNRIFGNGNLGIDLNDDGVTPNDDLDPDPGPNGLQNFPVITSATRGRTKTKVEGVLNSTPNETYLISIYQADGKSRQGKAPLGGVSRPAGPNGELPFSIKFVKPKEGKRVVATATRLGVGTAGATSEFSKPVKVK